MKRVFWLALGALTALGVTVVAQTITGVSPPTVSGAMTAADAGTCSVVSAGVPPVNGGVMTAGCAILQTQGFASITVNLTGTWAGTQTFEACISGCNNSAGWFAAYLTPVGGSTAVTTTTANGTWSGAVVGSQVRVRFSTFTSGTALVSVMATLSPSFSLSGGGGGAGTVTHTAGALTAGQLIVGNGSADIKTGDLTGDVTTSGATATTIAANAVTTAKINAAAVTLAKIQNAGANSVLVGSGAAGIANPYVEIALGTNLSMSGTTLNATAAATPFQAAYVSKTANYTAVNGTDGTVECLTNAFTVTLPTAVGQTGKGFIVKNAQTANVCTVATTSAQTIDGASTVGIVASAVGFVSDGANWRQVFSFGLALPNLSQGDTIYASAANTFTNLAKSTAIYASYTNTGASNNPAWASDLGASYQTKTAVYTLAYGTDGTVECLTNAFTLTLPTAVGHTGAMFTVKNLQTANTCTVATTSSQTIDGASTVGVLNNVLTFQSDGANWREMNSLGLPIASLTSGGIPYFSSTATAASSGLLAANAFVLGGGAGATPFTAAGLVTDGVSKVTLGVSGTSVGAVVFNNATSGAYTLQDPTGALTTQTISFPVLREAETLDMFRLPVVALFAAPGGTTTTASFVMMGLGAGGATNALITPQVQQNGTSPVIMIDINANWNESTIADGCNAKVAWGTGAAPANGAAATGTIIASSLRQYVAETAAGQNHAGFSTAITTGLTAGTQIWVDLQFQAVTGGTCTFKNVETRLWER